MGENFAYIQWGRWGRFLGGGCWLKWIQWEILNSQTGEGVGLGSSARLWTDTQVIKVNSKNKKWRDFTKTVNNKNGVVGFFFCSFYTCKLWITKHFIDYSKYIKGLTYMNNFNSYHYPHKPDPLHSFSIAFHIFTQEPYEKDLTLSDA